MNKAVTDAAGHCTRCGRAHANVEKLRATIKRLRQQLRGGPTPANRQRAHLRSEARREAAETGEPVEAIYKRWGVE